MWIFDLQFIIMILILALCRSPQIESHMTCVTLMCFNMFADTPWKLGGTLILPPPPQSQKLCNQRPSFKPISYLYSWILTSRFFHMLLWEMLEDLCVGIISLIFWCASIKSWTKKQIHRWRQWTTCSNHFSLQLLTSTAPPVGHS